jgi:putative ABC transport system ATP-binding protein
MNEIAVDVAHVAKAFAGGRTRVLTDVSFSIAAGELVVLVGPSGSGKSTTLHLVSALDRRDAGRIAVFGTDITRSRRLDRYRREGVGIVFQLHNLLPHLDACQNIEVVMQGTHTHVRERRAHAHALLERVGLASHAHARPPEMSGGERQRLAVARAFANRPRLILADEPTGSLDDESTARVVTLLREHCDGGGAVLAVSHDTRLTERADRVLELSEGVIREPAHGITPLAADATSDRLRS